MLVIDSVKLASIDHVLNVRYFDHRHAVFFQQIVNAAHEAVEIWHVGQDIAGVNHVGLITLRSQTSAQFVAKEFTDRRKDRKSTRLNSSHLVISYAVFCLKKKITT